MMIKLIGEMREPIALGQRNRIIPHREFYIPLAEVIDVFYGSVTFDFKNQGVTP